MNKIKQSVKSYLNTSVLPRFGFLVVNRFSEMLNDYTGKKFSYFHRIYSHISEIGGDIVECGVGCGQTLLILSIIAKNDEKHKRNIWGFDSFEGFPEATEEDKRKESLKGGNYHPMQTLEERLKAARIFDANFTETRIKLIKGFFEDSLVRYPGNPIAFLHLDVDLYKSYKDCLSQFYPHVVPGGVIAFDEYEGGNDEKSWPGARKAIDEFFAPNRLKPVIDTISKKAYLIKPKT